MRTFNNGPTKHAILRARERYGLKLNPADLRAVALACAEGTGLIHRWESSGRERHKIRLYGKTVTVIYQPFLGPSDLASPHRGAGLVLTVEPEEATMALAYELVKVDPPRDMRTAAQLICINCGHLGKLGIAGIGNNPEKINQMFIRLGWDADVWNPSKNWCPKCVKQRAERVREEVTSRRASSDTVEAIPVVGRIAAAPPAPPPSAPPPDFVLGAGTRTQGEVTEMKKLSPQQKGLLRTALESYFNPETGRYEPDWSDHRVSEELQIARRVVAEFRDTFYGELQEDPELMAIRQMVDEVKRTMGNLQASVQKIDTKMDGINKKYGGK